MSVTMLLFDVPTALSVLLFSRRYPSLPSAFPHVPPSASQSLILLVRVTCPGLACSPEGVSTCPVSPSQIQVSVASEYCTQSVLSEYSRFEI